MKRIVLSLLLLLCACTTLVAQPYRGRRITSHAQVHAIAFHCGENELLGLWDANRIDANVVPAVLLHPFSQTGSLFDIALRHRLMEAVSGYPLTEATRVRFDDEVLRVLYPADLGKVPRDPDQWRTVQEGRRTDVIRRIATADSILHVLAMDGCRDSIGCGDFQLQQSLRIMAGLKDTVMMMRIQLRRGVLLMSRGDYRTATRLALDIRDFASENILRMDEGAVELLSAECALRENELRQARQNAERAFGLFLDVEDPIGRAKAWHMLARIARADSREKDVVTTCQKALDVLASFPAGDILSEVVLLRAQISALMHDTEGVRNAMRSLHWSTPQPLTARLEALLLRAWLAEQDQRPFEARELYRSALTDCRRNEFRGMELRCLTGLAEMYQYTGENGIALRCFHAADSLARRLGDAQACLRLLRGIGDVHAGLAAWSAATSPYHQAFDIARRIHDARAQVELQLRLADMHVRAGQPDSTRRILAALPALNKGTGDPEHVAAYFLIDAALHLLRGDTSRAQGSLSASFQRLRGIRRPRLRGEIYLHHARLAGKLGQPHIAASWLDSALQAFDRDIAPRDRAEALLLMTEIEPSLGDTRGNSSLQRMRDNLREAFDLLESARARTAQQDLIGLYQVRSNDAYTRIAERMLDQCVAEDEALQYLETLHSRQLLETLERSGIEPDAAADSDLLRAEEHMLYQLDSLRRSRIHTDREAQAWSLDRAITEAERELRNVRKTIASTSTSLNDVRRGHGLRLKDIQQVLRRDEVFIEYAVFDSSAYAFVIPHDGRAHIVRLPVHTRVLNKHVENICAVLKQPPLELGSSHGPDKRLYTWLIQPLIPHIGTARHLIIAPGPRLSPLPFEAMYFPAPDASRASGYLIEQYGISYIHSGAVLCTVRQQERPTSRSISLFAVGDPAYAGSASRVKGLREIEPELLRDIQPSAFETRGHLRAPVFRVLPRIPGTGTEVRELEQLFRAHGGSAHALLARDATANAVLDAELAAFSYIHLACHGFAGSPPTLALAPMTESESASFISLEDVLRLRLPRTHLVALSACNTARGAEMPGEGVISLNRACLATGCRNVLSTLWSVYDEPTPHFIQHLYRAMLEEGQSPRAALQSAKRWFITSERYSAPCYWAPFVLYGDGG